MRDEGKKMAAKELADLLREKKLRLLPNNAARLALFDEVRKWLREYGEDI